MNASRANIRRSSHRRAYALLMVLMFNVLFLMLLGVAWRQMASAIRIAKVREEQVQRDEGVVCAMARAMNMLETGRPPLAEAATSYGCYTTITTSSGSRYFRLTFTPSIVSADTWTIAVAEESTAPVDVPSKLDTF